MKILCLDDEPLALKMLQISIEKAKPDAQVTAFSKQKELIAEAESNGCDVAFLDIHMRGMTGVEVAKKLKEINPKMNIIFVTGFSEYKGDAMDMKASGYIMKPVTAEEVAAGLDDLRFPVIPPKRTRCSGCSASATLTCSRPTEAPVHFERSRSKEIFAYLVHRHGSSCTTREIAAALFEDEPYDKKQQGYLQTLISAMIKSLKKIGAESGDCQKLQRPFGKRRFARL